MEKVIKFPTNAKVNPIEQGMTAEQCIQYLSDEELRRLKLLADIENIDAKKADAARKEAAEARENKLKTATMVAKLVGIIFVVVLFAWKIVPNLTVVRAGNVPAQMQEDFNQRFEDRQNSIQNTMNEIKAMKGY